jgi:nicotinate-nucleotide pyrophosphorylase (carboxylating)
MALHSPRKARILDFQPTRAEDAAPPRAAAAVPVEPPEDSQIDEAVLRALEEDCGARAASPAAVRDLVERDVTSAHGVPERARARARLVSKSSGRLAGLAVFARVFQLVDPGCRITLEARDGDALAPGQRLATVEGRARALLAGERTALNFVQRLSGIATLTARYVERCAGAARVLDTRKTTPGLRALEKYAVRCGGGENHRFGLFDEAMVKNNHLDLAGRSLAEVLRGMRAALGADWRITAEARNEREALEGVEGGADIVMLDNMAPARMRELCPRLREAARARGRPLEIEASGGVSLETVAEVAASGVDRVSVGALTHSAPALDLSLYLEPLA